MNILPRKNAYGAFAAASLMAMNPTAGAATEAPVSLPFAKPGVYVEIDSGAAQRIDIADRLRTMSQEVSAAACHLHAGIKAEESRAVLMGAHREFMGITDALLNGSARYDIIGHETRPRTLSMITEVISAWTSTDGAMMRLLDQPRDAGALERINESNAHLFKTTDALLAQLVAEYANPFEMLLGDAVMIDLSGRLSLMAQRISNDVCAVWKGDRTDAAFDGLTATIAKFSMSVLALRDGDDELGIKSAPTPQIERALDKVLAEWNGVFKKINATIADEDVTADQKAAVLQALSEKMIQLDQIVALYTEQAMAKAT